MDTGALQAGYLAFPRINVPPTLTHTGIWGRSPSSPHGKTGVFYLWRFLRYEPHFHLENWSGLFQILLILYFLPCLPPSSHVAFVLLLASRPLLSNAWNILSYFFHVQPIHILELSPQMPLPLQGLPWPTRSLQSAWLRLSIYSSQWDTSSMGADMTTIFLFIIVFPVHGLY